MHRQRWGLLPRWCRCCCRILAATISRHAPKWAGPLSPCMIVREGVCMYPRPCLECAESAQVSSPVTEQCIDCRGIVTSTVPPNSQRVLATTAIIGLLRALGLGMFWAVKSMPYSAGEYSSSLTLPPSLYALYACSVHSCGTWLLWCTASEGTGHTEVSIVSIIHLYMHKQRQPAHVCKMCATKQQ